MPRPSENMAFVLWWGVTVIFLLFPGCHAQTPCQLRNCPENTTFCVEQLSGETDCLACHEACIGCDGPSENNCLECKIGYIKNDGDFEACEACPDGRYGQGCQGVCHCLNSENCDKVSGECKDFLCESGYRTLPLCNESCIQGTFGFDCTGECHCPDGDTCNPVNGDCSSGQCHEDWTGPACSERLPKLTLAPKAAAVTCGEIRVEWTIFNEANDIGEGPVGKYRLYKQQTETNLWSFVEDITQPENQGNETRLSSLVTSGLLPDEDYIFRVDTVALKDGKDSRYVSPGNPSDLVYNLCTITTTPEVTTQRIFSRVLFDTVIAEAVDQTSIRLTWTVLPDYATYDYNVTVEIQFLGYGDCSVSPGQTRVFGGYKIDSVIKFSSLRAWQRYRLGVSAIGTEVDVSDSENATATTDPTTPSGAIANFSISRLTDTEVEIRWDPPSCNQRGGPFQMYEIILLNLNDSSATELKYLTQETELFRRGLQPFTTYSVKGYYINTEGTGPLSEEFYFETEEEAPGPVTILDLTVTHSTITVTFQPISMTTGILDTYTIRFSLTATFESFESKTISAAGDVNTIVIERLMPLTKYYLRMYANTRTKRGALGDVRETTTAQSPPQEGEILLNLKTRTTVCLTLEWTPPNDMENDITKYTLEIQEASADTSIAPVKVEFTQGEKEYQHCNLKPSQIYIVTVTAVINGTEVSTATEYFSTAHGTPATPVPPEFIRSTFTNITIAVEPLSLSDVRPTAYQIIVQPRGPDDNTIQDSYIAAELLPEDIPQQREFVVGDGLIYNGYTNTIYKNYSAPLSFKTILQELEENLYYLILYKALSTLNNQTTESESPMAMSVRTIPYDPSLAPPLHLSLSERTTKCLTFEWSLPSEQAPFVTGIRVTIRRAADSTEEPVIENLDSSARSYQNCNLSPFTFYTVDVTVRTSDGILTASSGTFVTEQTTPRVPVPPVFVNSSYSTITIAIEPVVLESAPLSFYQLKVEKITATGSRRKRMAGVPGYITAQLNSSEVPQRMEFIIGNNARYQGFLNKPLDRESTYIVHYVVVSDLNNLTKHSYSSLDPPVKTVPYIPSTQTPVTSSDSDNNTTLIIIIIALIILLLIIIILLLFCWWWRRRNRFNPYEIQEDDKSSIPLPMFVDNYDPQKYWSAAYNLKDSRHIIVGRELVYAEGQRPEMNGDVAGNPDMPFITFQQEFTSLPHKSSRAADNAARQNSRLNRFPHLLPYDHSLVKLKPDSHSRNTYINASFIPGYKKTPAYIAAQSPYDEETVLDFWRLIYQKSIKTVVMITNVVEDNIVKCTKYWPDHPKASYGNFLLHLSEITQYADYTIRTIGVKLAGKETSRIVRLFEFTSWPDHGVPDDPIPFLEMRYKIRCFHGDEKSPILVHCGTGMARTGVFIAVDALIDQYAAEGRVMVFDYIRRIRKDRPYMVRTQKQYIFIYEAIFEEFHAGDTLVDMDLKGRYHNWTQRNPKTDHTFLRDQFNLLQTFSRGPTQDECKAALLEVNKKKNRYLDVVPSEKHRPLLMSLGGPNPTDYINAFFVDGYLRKNQFILTQTPLHTTIIDFWKLVYDYDVRTIVMIDSFKNEDDSCAEYWPNVNMKQFEPFFIETTASYQQDNITIRNFKLLSTKNPKHPAKFVRQFQFNAWADPNSTPQSKTMLLDLIDSAFVWQEEACQNEKPVIVHCKDGSSHSGLFVAIAICCEKMEEDGEVDVYRTVKHIKRRRVQCIDDYDQFRFCYKSLWDFMNLRMSGGTFTNTLGQNRTDKSYGVASLSLNSYFDSLNMDTTEF